MALFGGFGKGAAKKDLESKIKVHKAKLIEARNSLPHFDLSRPFDLNTHEKDANGLYRITCPYCLTKFEVGDLLYRAAVVEDGNASYSNTFVYENDTAFERHWSHVGDESQETNRPHILNTDPAAGEIQSVTLLVGEGSKQQQQTVPYNPQTREAMKRYQVVYLTDKFGHKSATRICPHCHTEIPAELGFSPNYVFTLLGNSGCGKTVYLLRLVKTLCSGRFMDSTYQATVVNDETDLRYRKSTIADQVFRANGEQMSTATDVGYIRPVIIRLTHRRTLKKINITLFDYPGEAIWRTDNTFFQDLAQKNFENANGWLFLFDSGSLPFVNRELSAETVQMDLENGYIEDIASPDQILEQVHTYYGYGQTFTKPIAFVLSKSDMIRECAHKLEGNYLSSDPLFLRNPAPRKNVDMADLYRCDQEIRNMMAESNVTTDGDMFCRRNCCWFAVSATNVPVINGAIEEGTVPSGLRDTNPVEWLLYRCGHLEGDPSNAGADMQDVKDWATAFQMDVEEYNQKVRVCEDLNAEIQRLEMELANL